MQQKEELVDQFIARIGKLTDADIERKRVAHEALEKRRAERAVITAAKAAAAEAAEQAEEDVAESDSESEGGEHRIERLLVRRTFQAKAGQVQTKGAYVLVKWEGFSYADNTWQARKHLHAEATAELDRTAALPLTISELLELPPHATWELLERERMAPVPKVDDDDSELSEEEGLAATPGDAAAAGPTFDPVGVAGAIGEAAAAGVAVKVMPSFDPEVGSALEDQLAQAGLPMDETSLHAATCSLHAAAVAMRCRLRLPLDAPLQAAVTTPPSVVDVLGTGGVDDTEGPSFGLAGSREDRKVRITLLPPAAVLLADAAAARDAILPSVAPSGGAADDSLVIELTLPRKQGVDYDSDDEDAAAGGEGGGEGGAACGGGMGSAQDSAFAAALRAAIFSFDATVSKRLRGADLCVTGADLAACLAPPAAGNVAGPPLPAALVELAVLLLADRNSVAEASCRSLLAQLCAPAPSTAQVLWPSRHQTTKSGKARRPRAAAAFALGDPDEDEDPVETALSSFVPFGSVTAACGSSVRATVACAAGLAVELPMWGVHLRGDQPWVVRALRPINAVVLREGERSLVQAMLVDADGKGLPSVERLKGATLLTTPAIPARLCQAVRVQRDGAVDPTQHGQTLPIVLPKRELARFLQRLTEHEADLKHKAAAKVAAELDVEVDADGDGVDESAVLPAGTRRASYVIAADEFGQFEEGPLDAWLGEESGSDESYVEERKIGADGLEEDLEEEEEPDDVFYDDEYDDADHADDLDEDEDDGDEDDDDADDNDGGAALPRRPSERKAAKIGQETMRAIIDVASGASSGGACSYRANQLKVEAAALAADDPDDDDEDYNEGDEDSDSNYSSGDEGGGRRGKKTQKRTRYKEEEEAPERLESLRAAKSLRAESMLADLAGPMA